MKIATTERVIIEEFTVADAPFLFHLMNTPNWIKFIGDRNIKTVKDAEQALVSTHLKSYRENGYGFYKLRLNDVGSHPIGACGLLKRPTLAHADIGFALLPQYERKGFGFEASMAVLHYAETQLKLTEVYGITLPNNENAIHLLEKLGLTYQKTVFPFEDGKELLLFAKKLQTCLSTT